jgi:S-DNA-T family DNA segregation ATPase FtsK/SpoIIIE
MAEKKLAPKKTEVPAIQENKRKPVKKKREDNFEQLEINEKKKIPIRIISSVIFSILFLLFLVTWMEDPGQNQSSWFFTGLYKIVLGLFGRAAFYMAIPGFFFMVCIHVFSGKRPILMRSICLGVFLICFGCISHMWIPTPKLGSGFQWVKDIFRGGIEGTTGGLICGGLAELLRWIFHDIFTWIVLIIAGVLTLLASFRITIPSIVRAIQNRPRDQWANEKVSQDPAAFVVNFIANKRIERKEKKRRKKEEEKILELEVVELPPVPEVPIIPPTRSRQKNTMDQAEEMMRQIQHEEPLPMNTPKEKPQVDDSIFSQPGKTPIKRELTEDLPLNMPELDMDELPEVDDEPVVAVAEVKQKVSAKDAAESAAQVAEEIAQNEAEVKPEYRFPPIDLLKGSSGGTVDGTAEMRENTKRLNETLASFKIEARIINVTRGPSVTRYEVELDKGVRLNKLTTIADDIALSIGASGVRIAAVPGKISVVGIEVPNRAVSPVSLREVIDSNEFRNAKSKTTFSVGKDIGGNCITGNIAKLPHMLIAGTTGSGKSVCMNSIIISLLYKASPDDVKLIMIDPKMVELGIYNSIPHLLIPVVTDPKKAAGSLQWAVTEMMRRYKAMSDAGVRDLESFNAIVESEGEGVKLPQVVVIIDELADLMMVAAKEVEVSICRIAQMGRASGIHLVIATQRPSADVITGLMKANIPSRIAFSVASAMESRIILDTMGAEKLVGKGDMLFAPIGSGKPMRVQGCFVSDAEVEAVATYVKENFNTDYDNAIMEDIEKRASQAAASGNKGGVGAAPEANDAELEGDEMLPAAVDVILETNQASVSMLQRRLKLGYARAARIVDEMEEKGIVGPFQGSKPREILITKEQWATMRGNQPEQMELDDIPFDEGVPEELD